MEDALLRNDRADQEGDQRHDRDRLPADPVELIDQRRQPQRPRPAQHAEQSDAQRAQHLEKCSHVLARTDGGATDIADLGNDGVGRRDRRRGAAVDLTHLLDQSGIIVGYARDIGAMTRRCRAPRHFLQQPGAERVEFAYFGHIHPDGSGSVELRRDGVGKLLERGGVGGCPRAARTQLKDAARGGRR